MRADNILTEAADAVRSATSRVSQMLTPNVRVGVTGLARSGKTVFITALVRNLAGGGRLPFLDASKDNRLVRAWLEPQPDLDVPRFEYEAHLATLTAEPPAWPDSTRRISQLRLTVEYEPRSVLRRWMGNAFVHIDLVDYPGEWLLDLALMDQDYRAWSAEALALAREPRRAAHAAPFLRFLGGLDTRAPADDRTLAEGARLYTEYLAADRSSDEATATLGPGRFLMPGEYEGSPMLTFFPIEPADGAPPARSAAAELARRFDAYKQRIVEPFFRDHFSRLDRQIVLIDVLGALNRGGAAVADLERAMTSAMKAFRPGADSFLSFLLGRRIDRLLFCATKADHLHHKSHTRLEAILRKAAERAANRAEAAGADVEVMAIAALRATREAQAREGGETFELIAGVPLPGERLDKRVFDGTAEAAIFPGDLPATPEDAFAPGAARAGDHAFLRFRPPSTSRLPSSGVLPHIRLDKALQFLIGDKLE